MKMIKRTCHSKDRQSTMKINVLTRIQKLRSFGNLEREREERKGKIDRIRERVHVER